MDPAPRGPGWGLEAEALSPRQARNCPECQSLLCVALGGAACSCFGSFLVSWADTSNYCLERFGEARLMDYIFPSPTGHLFSRVFYLSPAKLVFLDVSSILWGPWD